MLIQGGTMSSGTSCTFSVVGSYWMSCSRSFWKTTLPGAVAMLRPTSKASRSVWVRLNTSPDRSMSWTRLAMPCTRFLPLVANVSRSTSGLVSGKLEGDRALPSCFRWNSARWRVRSSSPSVLLRTSSSQRMVIR